MKILPNKPLISKRNGILLLGLFCLGGGLIGACNGTLFKTKYHVNPYYQSPPGIVFLLAGIFIVFFSLKNRKQIR